MDEGIGAIAGVLLAIALVVWIVGLILQGIAWIFVALSALVGNPAILFVMLCAVGGLVGVARHRRRLGSFVAGSSEDLASIGPLDLPPEQWAIVVIGAFALVVGVFGALFAA